MSSLARWVSVFFDSSVLSLFIFPAIGWEVAGWGGVAWALLALFILTGIPLAYIFLYLGEAPHTIWQLALVYACLGVTMFTISNFWKISLHMVSVGGFASLLVYVFGPGVWWLFLGLPLVAWARLYRRKHTPAQLFAGALAGILITALVLTLSG
jgi:membrane-associated phospholipid phosphatase